MSVAKFGCNLTNTDWNAERIAQLTVLWVNGLPVAGIAKRMDLSKGAISGKAHRLKLAARASPINTHATYVGRATKPPAQRKPKPPSLAFLVPMAQANPAPVTQRASDHAPKCQEPLWPSGTSGAPLYPMCGAPCCDRSRSYCDQHAKKNLTTRQLSPKGQAAVARWTTAGSLRTWWGS